MEVLGLIQENGCEYFKELKNALERYIKYVVLGDENDEALKGCEILLVPICLDVVCETVNKGESCWSEFKKILKGEKKLEEKVNNEVKKINGILFVNFSGIFAKETQAIRMFFENTMCAETVNSENITSKLKKLIVRIKTDCKNLGDERCQ